MNKLGIIFTVFGSNQSQVSLGLAALESQAREKFALPVRWAFTSEIMRTRLASERKKSDSLTKALRKMEFEQFRQLVVQPLQVIPGLEYEELGSEVNQVLAISKLQIILGQPLLRLQSGVAVLAATPTSVLRLAVALQQSIPVERNAEDVVLFMGHGSKHQAQKCYEDLHTVMQELDANCGIVTLSSNVQLENIAQALCAKAKSQNKTMRIWLIPLLASVGKHTLQDMVNGSDSWQMRLKSQGYEVCAVIKGLSEQPAVVKLWLENLQEALSELR